MMDNTTRTQRLVAGSILAAAVIASSAGIADASASEPQLKGSDSSETTRVSEWKDFSLDGKG